MFAPFLESPELQPFSAGVRVLPFHFALLTRCPDFMLGLR